MAGLLGRKLDAGPWQIVLSDGGEGAVRLRTVRMDLGGLMDVFAEVRVIDLGDGSAVSLEFTLIPTTKVPGFDDWLADRDAAALP